MRFAAFVMTYKRPEALEDTISKLFSQTLPPQKVLIVDNDPERSAENISSRFAGNPVLYFSVGYNSGPAGAAYYGLKILAEENWDWIAWIDDDDPPVFDNTFEILFNRIYEFPNLGCIGAVGQYINSNTGKIKRVPDSLIQGDGVLRVANIAGNMYKIINADVVRKLNILPDKMLFFGFEELDFDLKLKNAGLELLVDKNLYLRHRIHFNRLGRKRSREFVNVDSLWRQYFSSRNMLIILLRNRYYSAFILSFLRVVFKSFLGFRNGWTAGKKILYYNSLALLHFLINRRGNPFLNES